MQLHPHPHLALPLRSWPTLRRRCASAICRLPSCSWPVGRSPIRWRAPWRRPLSPRFSRWPGEFSSVRQQVAIRGGTDSGRVNGCGLSNSVGNPLCACRLYGETDAPASWRPIWGTSLRASPAHAALCNSAAIRCLDANDLYIPPPPQSTMSAGHCSDALGGVLALAQPQHNSGQQLLAALVVVRTNTTQPAVGMRRTESRPRSVTFSGAHASLCYVLCCAALTGVRGAGCFGVVHAVAGPWSAFGVADQFCRSCRRGIVPAICAQLHDGRSRHGPVGHHGDVSAGVAENESANLHATR